MVVHSVVNLMNQVRETGEVGGAEQLKIENKLEKNLYWSYITCGCLAEQLQIENVTTFDYTLR